MQEQKYKLLKTSTPRLLEYLFIFLMIIVFTFKFKIAYNEMDVIPFAKSTFNKSWLPNDWYLNLKIPYRYLFSYTIGFFAEKFGTVQTIIFGRLISYILVTISIISLLRALNPKSNNFLNYFALIAFFNFFVFGNGAGEWMVGGLETKVFAYAFALLSLASFLKKKHYNGFLFAGLSLSFHLLVGIYNLFCLIPIFIFLQIESKSFYINVLKSIPLFLIAGSLGVYGIIYQLLLSNKDLSNLGWDIYVNIRVPHHTLPSHLPIEMWVKIALFTIINILFVLKFKNQKVKLISYYALSSVVINLIGLIIFLIPDASHHLKYYFFRFSDIVLPLITLLNVSIFLFENANKISLKKQKIITYLLLIASSLLIFSKSYKFQKNFTTNISEFKAYTSDDPQMENWIKNNTNKTESLITPPDANYFYINFERPLLVSWKHSPQNSADIIEWYNRLKLLNKNKDFKDLNDVRKNYQTLTEENILDIVDKYPSMHYFLTSDSVKLNFPLLFKSNKHALYKIKTLNTTH